MADSEEQAPTPNEEETAETDIPSIEADKEGDTETIPEDLVTHESANTDNPPATNVVLEEQQEEGGEGDTSHPNNIDQNPDKSFNDTVETGVSGDVQEEQSGTEAVQEAQETVEEVQESVQKGSETAGPSDNTVTNDTGAGREVEPIEIENKPEGFTLHDNEGGEDVDEEPVLSRDDILAELKQQLLLQEQNRGMNAHLQHKIAEYLLKKKTEDRHDPSKSVTDHEQRYMKCIGALDSLQAEYGALEEKRKLGTVEMEEKSKQHLNLVEARKLEYILFCKQKSLEAVYSRTGRILTAQEFDHLVAEDNLKEKDVIQARLENVRLQTVIAKKEALVKQKEELGEGLHVIDFEQLKIDNVNLNEKIEERNEDLIKLRKKITGTVQVLTHVKEKLQFVQAENEDKRCTLGELDTHLAKRRDHLTRFKQVRDALRIDNVKLRHQGGLVSHLDLLKDFEDQVDKNEDKEASIESMQRHYGSTMMACNRIRKKTHAAACSQRLHSDM